MNIFVDENATRADADRDLARRGEISQVILDHYDGGAERLLAALIEKFGMPEKPVTFDHDLLTTSVQENGSQIVFSARIDTKQVSRHRQGGTEEDFPGADEMYADLRQGAQAEARARVEAAGRMLDELRMAYAVESRPDGGWQIRIDESTINSALEAVGQHDLQSETGRQAAMRVFWEDRDARVDQAFGQVAGTRAAEEVGRRLAAGSAVER